MRKTIFFSIIFYLSISALFNVQNTVSAQEKNIFEILKKTDTLGSGTVKIFQDKRIENLIVDKKSLSNSSTQANGYRVQVFSSNTQRTAKSEAYKIEKNLKETFPNNSVYLSYSSPFWKVRIGDFKTLQEAQKFRLEVIDAFPNYKSETYAVKDKINF